MIGGLFCFQLWGNESAHGATSLRGKRYNDNGI